MNDRKRWQQFFDSYWRLIHRAARKAGLTESEAQEVVQETLITVAKKIDHMAAAACGMNIHWTRKWGLLITVDWAGPESVEAEAPASSRPALILANAPEMQIVPGREGWQALPSLKTYDEMGGGKDPKSEAAAAKAWKKIERAIPKKQYMQTAG